MSIRVLVADASPFCRRLMSDWIRADSEFQCLAAVGSLPEALDSVRHFGPDVLCLDMAAWGERGLDCLREIMLRAPVRTLVLTSSTADGSSIAFDALASGAIDFLAKPYASSSFRMSACRSRFLEKIRLVAQAQLPGDRRHGSDHSGAYGAVERVIAIIGGAGGPGSLQAMFSAWPASDVASVLVLQHVPPCYGSALTKRVGGVGLLPLAEAVDGTNVVPGKALLLPMGVQVEVLSTQHLRLRPSTRPLDPRADDLLLHLSERYGPDLVAVFLSGSGTDGLVGASAVRKAGGAVLTESEGSATVPETIRQLKAANLVDAEADADRLPAATAAFGSVKKRRAG